jgi:hypothetical protein
MPEPHLRAADSDREAVSRCLGEHMSAGRLTPAEYEERVGQAWAARTYGDLAELTADLPPATPPRTTPSVAPAGSPTGVAAPRWRPAHGSGCAAGPGGRSGPEASGRARGGSLRAAWSGWLTTALVFVTIWLMTSFGGGGSHGFWPIWIIGPWGAVLLARTLRGPAPRHDKRSVPT